MGVRIKIIILLSLLAATVSGLLYFQFLRTQPARQSSFFFHRTNFLEIREDTREGVTLPASSPLVMEKIVPADARLFFAFGVPKQEWDPSAEPYRFTVSLERRKSEILYEKELSPSAKKQDRRWQEVNLDLSKYGKQLVRFQFRFVSKKPQMISYLSQVKLTAGAFENVKPNVLLITIDTLRRDHVSAYGYNHHTTPAIDAFIKSSTVFTKGYSSAPLTVPSITSLMTSTYFSQHQVANNASAFDKTLPTLAEVLRNNGYSTAAFVGNAVLRPNRGLDAGFNVYNAYLPDSEINRRLPERNAQQLTDAALAWLGTHRQERFFLWLHYQDPHAPYTPPPPYNSMFLPSRPSAVQLTVVPNVTGDGGIPPYALLPGHFDPAYYVSQYDGEIRFADAGIQRILSALEESELRRNTIIVILADHGESLGENHFYFSHGHNVTPELIDVPLVISVPKKGFEKRTYPVQNVDVGPTVLRLLNLPVPPTFRGQVLFRTDSDRKAIAEQPNVRWAVYCERGLYIYDRTGSEEFQGSDSSMIPALRKTVQDLIANNLSNGILFSFSGEMTPGAKILSDQPFRRAFLFGGEEEDRIEIESSAISLNFQTPAQDIDYVFVEPQTDAIISAEGFSMRDGLNKTVPSSFHMSDIPKSLLLPTSREFSSPGCIVIRKAGRINRLELTNEQKEELKSVGYVDQ